jgi:hypothetical protein
MRRSLPQISKYPTYDFRPRGLRFRRYFEANKCGRFVGKSDDKCVTSLRQLPAASRDYWTRTDPITLLCKALTDPIQTQPRRARCQDHFRSKPT